jgi:hypothetical protein
MLAEFNKARGIPPAACGSVNAVPESVVDGEKVTAPLTAALLES